MTQITKHMQRVDEQIIKTWRSTEHQPTLQCCWHLQSMMPLAASEHPDSLVFSCSVVEQTCLSECVLFDSNSFYPTAMTSTSVWMETSRKKKTDLITVSQYSWIPVLLKPQRSIVLGPSENICTLFIFFKLLSSLSFVSLAVCFLLSFAIVCSADLNEDSQTDDMIFSN